MTVQIMLAMRYLWGRKLRSALTTLAIVFGVMVLFGTGSLIPTMMQSLRQNTLAAAGKVDLTATQVSGGSFGLDRLQAVQSAPGIAHATGSLQQTVPLPPALQTARAKAENVTGVTVVGIDPATAQSVRAYPLAAGRFLADGDGNAVVLPESLAQTLGVTVGSTLTLPSAEGSASFEVVGLVTTLPTPGVQEVWMPLTTAQQLLNQPGQINTIAAMYAGGADATQVEAAVQAALGEGYQLTPLESGGQLATALALGEQIFLVVGILALLMGGFVILNTFRTLVAERRRDLGMLRAVGATRRTILGLILAESLVQGVVGTVLGMVAGYALVALLVAVLNPVASQIWRFQIGSPQLSWTLAVESVVLGVGITVASGLAPALAAMRVTPMEALRPAGVGVEVRRLDWRAITGAVLIALAVGGLVSGASSLVALGVLLFLAGLLLAAPALVRPLAKLFGRLLAVAYAREGQIAQGNLARQPGRAAVTASTVMISLTIVVATAGLVTTLTAGIRNLVTHSLSADYLIMPSSLLLSGGNLAAGPALAQEVQAVPGIGAMSTLRLSYASVDGQQLQVIGIDPSTYPEVGGLQFGTGNPQQAYAALAGGRAIILNGIFALQSRAKVGRVLSFETPAGPRDYTVVGIANDFLNAKVATGWVSQANLAADFFQTSDILLMANRAPGADAQAVQSKLAAIIGQYPAFTLLDAAGFQATVTPLLNMAFSLVYVLVIVLAVPSLIAMVNTLAISVLERTREIGTLRAVGSTRRQVGRMIRAESVLLAALGTAFGLLTGVWLAYVMTIGLNAAGFQLQFFFPWGGLLIGVAAGLLLGVVAASIPARQAAKMDIVSALHYE